MKQLIWSGIIAILGVKGLTKISHLSVYNKVEYKSEENKIISNSCR